MICIIALIVFGILGIFSATHRQLVKEAFDCVFRRITFRKCESGLDIRLKSRITGRLMKRSPILASKMHRHFELISWAFIILFIVSFIYVAIGGYNYYLYGNCNGPNEDGFCIFDPLGEKSKFSETQSCSAEPPNPESLTLFNVDLSLFPSYDKNAENDVVFIGCYACPYTRKAYPAIKKLLDRKDINFVFAHFPAKESTYFISNILNCINEADKDKFIEFNELIFTSDTISLKNEDEIFEVVEKIGLDKKEIKYCSYLERTHEITKLQMSELQKTGIYGTPTVFINGGAVVGPKPYRVYKRLLK